MKKLILTLAFFFIFSYKVSANEIKSIDMDIYVDNNGNAQIIETWDVYTNEGTEIYKPYYNLGSSEIIDFTVNDKNENYKMISWNPNDDFSAKKYKYGINYIDNGLELCAGISEYGNNTFTFSYTITNFVVRTNDADMIYWTLIPYELSTEPKEVNIKIHSAFDYSSDIGIWGYGKYGAELKNTGQTIEMIASDGLKSSEYMTILIKFDLETFELDTNLDEDFDFYLNMAEENSERYQDSGTSIFAVFIVLFSWALVFGFIVFATIYASKPKYGFNYGKFGKKMPKDLNYFRDLPASKSISRNYYIATHYGLIKKNTDLLGALLLYWTEIDYITISEDKKGKKNIIFKDASTLKFEVPTEKELYEWMVTASEDGILEKNEFSAWCKTNYNKMLNWFNNILKDERENLVKDGLLIKEGYKYTATLLLYEEAKKLAGLKKFFKEFTRLNEKNPIEVKLWKDYLILAQIFGMANKVAKEFKKLYPDVITDESYDSFTFVYGLSYSGISSAQTASHVSSSGSGFSSGGGGFGSFGGGGGGGGFR
jgi:uncharacterized membrane protein YgcG